MKGILCVWLGGIPKSVSGEGALRPFIICKNINLSVDLRALETGKSRGH